MNDNLFRILAIIIFVICAGISIYYRRKADRESGERVSLKDEGLPITIALRLSGLALWLGVFAYLLNPAWMNWSRLDLPEWARWVGVGMGALADVMAYWVFSHLGNNVTPTVATRSSAMLVTGGPYRWVRHPLYTMSMIACLGFALLAESWFIALMAVVSFSVLAIRVPREEAKLIEKFGDAYRNYIKTTGRYLPRLG
jgi:protein-S-isoprenylcysteine O-methyltransferase Ste14